MIMIWYYNEKNENIARSYCFNEGQVDGAIRRVLESKEDVVRTEIYSTKSGVVENRTYTNSHADWNKRQKILKEAGMLDEVRVGGE